ncbi:MAG: Gfo/Idh/MocA family oxidoreductase [Planctomycetes bacterium]|nr:Gfo/Idh/MocA family oxidoreductase [Planctomycetota bacterium]
MKHPRIESDTMSKTFKIAIIGAGGIANAHMAAAKDSGGRVEVVAVVDPIQESRSKLVAAAGQAADFADVDALIKARKGGLVVEGVLVCTPPSVRVKIVEKCLKAGLPVLSEKPLASTLKDAKKLASLARKYKKVPTAIGYCHRFTPALHEMNRMAASGELGTIVRFENFFACDLPGHQSKWFSDPKKAGGGAFLDMGSHSIDLFHAMIGPGKPIASVFSNKWKGRTETAATVVLKGSKKRNANIGAGVPGVIISGWAESSRFTVALVGDKAMVSYDYENPEVITVKDLLGKADVRPIKTCGVRFTDQLVAFANVVQIKANNTGLATFEDGLAAAMVGEQAAKLAKKK